jgi:photosystem II stability/assembly factor-like uncharacterized protein
MAGTILKTTDGGLTWTIQNSGTYNTLRSISCPTLNSCFTVGDNGTILTTTDGGQNWTSQTSGTTTQLNSISCPSPSTCFVAPNNSDTSRHLNNRVLATTNGGNTWTTQDAAIVPDLNSISCPDTTTCFAAGLTNSAYNLTVTTNGGATWTPQNSGTSYLIAAIHCTSSTNCYFITQNTGVFSHTTNAGQTWVSQSFEGRGLMFGLDCPGLTTCYAVGDELLNTTDGSSLTTLRTFNWIFSVSCPTLNTCYAAGDGGRILKTTNGGNNWYPVIKDTNESYYSVSCPNTTTCLMVGANGKVYRTSDSAPNWLSLTSGVNNSLYGLTCLPGTSPCFAVGAGGLILTSSDTGTSWIPQTSGVSADLNAVECSDLIHCFAVGADGLILATTDGDTWTAQTSGTTKNLYALTCLDLNSCYVVGDSGIILFTANAGTTWTAQTSGTTKNLRGVTCTSPTNCLVAAGYYPSDPSNLAYIYATTNSGTTWQPRLADHYNSIRAIKCPTASYCYAIGGTTVEPTRYNVFLYSTDGGLTWKYELGGIAKAVLYSIACFIPNNCVVVGDNGSTGRVTLSGTGSSPTAERYSIAPDFDFSSVSCPDTNTCYGVGENYIASTKDQGQTWQLQQPFPVRTAYGFIDIACPSVTTCFIAGNEFIAATTDGGTNWNIQFKGSGNNFQAINCLSTTNCYAVTSGTRVFTTTNGGTNWILKELTTNNYTHFQAISCVSLSSCLVLGNSGYNNTSTIYSTTDGGATWTAQTPSLSGIYNDLACIKTTSTCYLVGDNGKIALTTNAGTSWNFQNSGTSKKLHSISCPVSSVCYVLSPNLNNLVLVTFNGGLSWNSQIPGSVVSTNLSCASATVCTMVGTYGAILTNRQTSNCANPYNVTLSTDDGSATACGTLSYALKQASGATTPVTIALNTPQITLTGVLPTIANPNNLAIILSATCTPSAGTKLSTPGTRLMAGSGAGSSALTLTSNITLTGLVITGFSGYALNLAGNNNTLGCNWLGTADGATAAANGGGIHLSGSNNRLGIAGNPASGNLISGNTGSALLLESSSKNNQAFYNWFGYRNDGLGLLPNQGGIKLLPGAELKFGPGNHLHL